MNRRKTIQRYQRLHNSQWYKDYPSKPNKNCHIIKSCRMLIAARKRVPPWHVRPVYGHPNGQRYAVLLSQNGRLGTTYAA